MEFPLSLWDIGLWLGTTAMLLLVTSELLSLYYGQTSFVIEKRRLRIVALMLGLSFILIVLVPILWMKVAP